LYVSDFFDEEEELSESCDKSQKGDVAEAQRLAAEQIALGRVERERHIEATQERVEPLSEMEHPRLRKVQLKLRYQQNNPLRPEMPVSDEAGADVVVPPAQGTIDE